MGVENNHSLDLGKPGRQATLSALGGSGLIPLSYENSPQFILFDDVTVAVLTFSMVPGQGGPDGDVELLVDLRRKLRQARNLANFVVAYVHWGSEFLDWPDERQRHMARRLIANGVDVVVGHHPHVVQKVENLDGKPVFYSLGNFLFDQRYPSTKEGLLADCRFSSDTARCSAITTRTPRNSTYPSVTGVDGEAEAVLARCTVKARPSLAVNSITLRPVSVSPGEEVRAGLVLEADREGKRLWKSPRAKIASLEKMEVEGKAQREECLFTLEPHYSPMDGEAGLRPCVYAVHRNGLIPKWRGTALAWPLKDAALLPGAAGILCGLHRGDSFLVPNPQSRENRIAVYRWNGFGFSGIHEPELIKRCTEYFQ
jgi:poly-gamma-glutamate synthesis protein (capsule biosynthesis protein)